MVQWHGVHLDRRKPGDKKSHQAWLCDNMQVEKRQESPKRQELNITKIVNSKQGVQLTPFTVDECWRGGLHSTLYLRGLLKRLIVPGHKPRHGFLHLKSGNSRVIIRTTP
jgi:hypothetical protein